MQTAEKQVGIHSRNGEMNPDLNKPNAASVPKRHMPV